LSVIEILAPLTTAPVGIGDCSLNTAGGNGGLRENAGAKQSEDGPQKQAKSHGNTGSSEISQRLHLLLLTGCGTILIKAESSDPAMTRLKRASKMPLCPDPNPSKG
jgi:hypothetical protein